MSAETPTFPNSSTLWAHLFVEELARAGLRTACIAPGSRSTPLTMAFTAHPDIRVHSLLDERSAAFFALGIGLATGKPAALVCTSGTAAANFYPAIVEANYSHVPLLVLTADRPPELRESGANQTVDQVKMYGHQVRWFVDVPLPESDPAPSLIRYLRALAGRAIGQATGLPPGPVQLNFPFRKPLEPVALPGFVSPPELWARADSHPFTSVSRGRIVPDAGEMDVLEAVIRKAQRGMIVCGPRCPEGKFPAAVAALARAAEMPVFADALSGTRFGLHVNRKLFLSGYETFLPALRKNGLNDPDFVLHFGAPPISAKLTSLMGELAPGGFRFAIREFGDWQDDTYTTSHLMWADPELVCDVLAARLYGAKELPRDPKWLETLREGEARTWKVIDRHARKSFFEGMILAEVVDEMPEYGNLFVASSLPVRHLDQFARVVDKPMRVFANRGASGIDGTISSALGAAASSEQPLVLVLGDLAFYHDLNGLLALRRCGLKITIVLINNNGGGIFRRLPVAAFDPPFTDLFLTPHGLDFAPAAEMFGLEYVRVTERVDFRTIFRDALVSETSHLIEIQTDSVLGEEMSKKISNL